MFDVDPNRLHVSPRHAEAGIEEFKAVAARSFFSTRIFLHCWQRKS